MLKHAANLIDQRKSELQKMHRQEIQMSQSDLELITQKINKSRAFVLWFGVVIALRTFFMLNFIIKDFSNIGDTMVLCA